MLYEFLLENRQPILFATEKKSLELAGIRPSSEQLKQGLPIFYGQLLSVLKPQSGKLGKLGNVAGMAEAARNQDEGAMAIASEHPEDENLARSAGLHGTELLRLGYTLSHVVHAYGAMCQAITELAMKNNILISAEEFHDLNRCLDVAIAGAVTEFQSQQDVNDENREVQHLGFLAHELRNALSSVAISLQLIKGGTISLGGNTGLVLDRGVKRMGELIDRSLTEVRLRVDPKLHIEEIPLLVMIDQILITAQIEADQREQTFDIQVQPSFHLKADQQLLYSVLSNLIQNAIKYTKPGGKITVRAKLSPDEAQIEVQDECGGLPTDGINLFKPYEQHNENKKGLGLGLTIAKRAIDLSLGTITVEDRPKEGCIFKVVLPQVNTSFHP